MTGPYFGARVQVAQTYSPDRRSPFLMMQAEPVCVRPEESVEDRSELAVCPGSRGGRSRSVKDGLISGWTIESRYGHSVHPVINGELAAVVNDVVHDHGANNRDLRHGEEDLVARSQRPCLHEIRIGGAGDCGAGRSRILIGNPQKMFA